MHLLIALSLLGGTPAEASAAIPEIDSASPILAAAHNSERPTVVHFWASWCEPCVRELPQIRRLAQGLLELHASLVLVSLDDSPDVPAAVIARFHLAGPNVVQMLLHAPDPAPVTSRFNARWRAELPATFVVLQSGEVADSHLGTTPVEVVLREVRDRINASDAGPASPARRMK